MYVRSYFISVISYLVLIEAAFIGFCHYNISYAALPQTRENAATAPSSALSYRVQACECEIEMLKKSVEMQEDCRDILEKEVKALMKVTKESAKESVVEAIAKAANVEKQLDKLSLDIKELKSYLQETSKSINDLTHSYDAAHKTQLVHSQAIQSLEKAMRSLTLALKGKKNSSTYTTTAPLPPSVDTPTETYTVKSGDTLEKIARTYKISIQTLKDINNLTSDTIRQGQELQVGK